MKRARSSSTKIDYNTEQYEAASLRDRHDKELHPYRHKYRPLIQSVHDECDKQIKYLKAARDEIVSQLKLEYRQEVEQVRQIQRDDIRLLRIEHEERRIEKNRILDERIKYGNLRRAFTFFHVYTKLIPFSLFLTHYIDSDIVPIIQRFYCYSICAMRRLLTLDNFKHMRPFKKSECDCIVSANDHFEWETYRCNGCKNQFVLKAGTNSYCKDCKHFRLESDYKTFSSCVII